MASPLPDNDPDPVVAMQFHPSFPDTWQVSLSNGAIKLQEDKPADPDDVELSLQAAHRLRIASDTTDSDIDRVQKERTQFQQGSLLLAGQIFEGHAHGTAWIQTSMGYVPLANTDNKDDLVAKPFWPAYRVTNSTFGSMGVVPYVCSIHELTKSNDNGKVSDDGKVILKDYDCSSPLRSKDLTKRVGYVFNNPEEPIPGLDPKKSKWWTHDGNVWWPKSVPAWDFLGIQMPHKVACVNFPPKPVMSHAVTMSTDYIKVGFQGRGYLLTAIIMTEYIMIIAGVLAGIEFGWSIRLQLIYVLFLFLLSLCEILFVWNRVPNGRIWMRINIKEVLIALWESTLSRWDLYSDVGFAVLAFQQRDRLNAPLWIGSTVICTFVIGVRLLYSGYYVRILSKKVDEKSLAKVSAPSFMTLFQLLCEMMNSNDGAHARKLTVRTELAFEAFLLFFQDIPEIGLQAAYLTDPNAPAACTDCAYGFVIISFLVSILTALTTGSFRTFVAYRKYVNVAAEIASENSTAEVSTKSVVSGEDSGENATAEGSTKNKVAYDSDERDEFEA